MTIQEILDHDVKFQYMMLGRLLSDCRSQSSIWADSMKEQLEYMTAIWNNLKVKPEWLPFKELNRLSIKYARVDLQTGKSVD